MYDLGNGLKINIEGGSHSKEMRVTLSGFPAGFRIDREELCRFMKRRAPGGVGTTARREPDIPIFSAGVENDTTTGVDIEIIIENTDVRESDYEEIRDVPRPGHADYALFAKYGEIPSGGGKASGRMTVLLCAAGGIALQYLRDKGIFIGAHAESIGGVLDLRFDPCAVTPEEISAIAEILSSSMFTPRIMIHLSSVLHPRASAAYRFSRIFERSAPVFFLSLSAFPSFMSQRNRSHILGNCLIYFPGKTPEVSIAVVMPCSFAAVRSDIAASGCAMGSPPDRVMPPSFP